MSPPPSAPGPLPPAPLHNSHGDGDPQRRLLLPPPTPGGRVGGSGGGGP